jgi:hypothetical protein
MSVWGRLGAFFVVLLGTFGTAYAVGEKLPGHTHAGHTHTHGPATLVPPGFEYGNYQLVTDSIATGADGGELATFHLERKDGTPVTDYTVAHDALIHVIKIRPDLSGFEHLHPDIAADGTWQIAIPEPGKWHLVFDTTPKGESAPIVVSANVDDEATVPAEAVPAADDDVVTDGLHIVRSGLNFTVTADGGGPATGLEPYLGQAAHLVAIRQGDLAYVHLHAATGMDGMLMFGTTLPQAGTYRLFLQFGHNGTVVTVPFTVVQP